MAGEKILALLRNLPDREAQDVLQRLRSGTDVRAILNHIEAGDLLLQMRMVPESRCRYEFPYRTEMPDHVLKSNLYLNSMIYEGAALYSADQHASLSAAPTSSRPLTGLRSADYRDFYTKPFHAAHLVDARLSDVNISWWTSVSGDHTLMRDLLSVFFRCEYHFTAAFQKDLFLEDLAAKRQDFCSPLLVNVVLAYACVWPSPLTLRFCLIWHQICYPPFLNRAEHWNPHTLHYRFLAEAKRLWELEATKARVTTVQAGIIFSVIHNLSGLDEIGQAYRIHAIAVAHELHLFDDTVDEQGVRIQNGRAFAAWALYNWETWVHSIQELDQPLTSQAFRFLFHVSPITQDASRLALTRSIRE